MYALNWTLDFTADDGLEPLAPLSPPMQGSLPVRPAYAAAGVFGAATSGLLIAVLVTLTGAQAPSLVLALGGVSGFMYLGTALVSGRPGPATLDLLTAGATFAIVLTAAGPAVTALLVHVVWGILRGAWPAAAPGRSFATCWAALNATAALLLGFGA